MACFLDFVVDFNELGLLLFHEFVFLMEVFLLFLQSSVKHMLEEV